MKANNNLKGQEYKKCAGTNCNNIARYLLSIVLIKQFGWFCEKCSHGLQKPGLIESVIDEHIKDKKGGDIFG
jgi:hypothetical protein